MCYDGQTNEEMSQHHGRCSSSIETQPVVLQSELEEFAIIAMAVGKGAFFWQEASTAFYISAMDETETFTQPLLFCY